MALTIAAKLPVRKIRGSSMAFIVGSLTVGTYATGGISLSGLSKYFIRNFKIFCDSPSGYFFAHDTTNNKLMCYTANATEMTATDPGVTVNFLAVGDI